MRKLWVKAWMTLDGVFDADTMDYWWQTTRNAQPGVLAGDEIA